MCTYSETLEEIKLRYKPSPPFSTNPQVGIHTCTQTIVEIGK